MRLENAAITYDENKSKGGQIIDLPALALPALLENVDLRAIAFQTAIDEAQEARRAQAIVDAVVEREANKHHRANGNGIILNDDGPLDCCIHAQDARVRLIDDGYGDDGAKDARVVDCEGRALHILRGQLVGARPRGKVADRPR